uniref:Uncharacterized protein n=1 Tax=Panagrolaimus sp. ES5 TaxID=591445 RepID=A0AC34F9I2_9BILA
MMPDRHHHFQEALGAPAFAPYDQINPAPPRINRRNHDNHFIFDMQQAQNEGPLNANANLNNEVPRFVNINIGQNNMVHMNQNPVHIRVEAPVGHRIEHEPIIHEPIVGQPLNAQNDMEPAALDGFPQRIFEQPVIQFEEVIEQDIILPAVSPINSRDGTPFSDDDDIVYEDGVALNDEDEVHIEREIGVEMERQINEEVNQLNEPLQLQPVPAEQQPNELIDLTEIEDDEVPVCETDLKHIERIHDKGERFEVLPIDMNSFVHETRQLDKDWNYVYTLIDELSISNEKMRESVNINETEQEPEKAKAIRETLDIHDDIANYIKQKMAQLNAQSEKINNI